MKPTLKLLHTADWHLGAKFLGLGPRGVEQRRRLREIAQEIADLAVSERVQAVLLAGDLFDSQTPSPDSLGAFRRALATLAAAGIPALAVAGTHDLWSEGGFWPQLETETAGGLIVLSPARPAWTRPDLGLTVRGTSQEANDRPERPLAALRRGPEPGWQIGLAHAALEIGDRQLQESRFSSAEIASTGLDYLALGHWHGAKDVSARGVSAWYAGAPEMIALDEGQGGQVLIVELAEGRPAAVTPRQVGRRRLRRVEARSERADALAARLIAEADGDAVLELTCSGLVSPGAEPDAEELRKMLAPHFFHVRVKDATALELGEADLAAYPETTAAGRFVRLLQAEIAAAEPARREDLRRALQLGLALLEGREVTRWS